MKNEYFPIWDTFLQTSLKLFHYELHEKIGLIIDYLTIYNIHYSLRKGTLQITPQPLVSILKAST